MPLIQEKTSNIAPRRLPSWLRQDIPDAGRMRQMREALAQTAVHTVCESAHCPNSGQCWQQGVATVMVMGDTCTRQCKFCAVKKGPVMPLDKNEPARVAQLVAELNLRYAVVTSVTRDDLDDGGAEHFAQTIHAIRGLVPATKIEVLVPDFNGNREALAKVIAAAPDVVGHNIEMAERLFPAIRPRAEYQRSLAVLRRIKAVDRSMIVKSGFMVGLGETEDEIRRLFSDLAKAGCDIVTVGQYLAPTRDHYPSARFVSPDTFAVYQEWGIAAGIPRVVSEPLVRSSFLAETEYSKFIAARKS